MLDAGWFFLVAGYHLEELKPAFCNSKKVCTTKQFSGLIKPTKS